MGEIGPAAECGTTYQIRLGMSTKIYYLLPFVFMLYYDFKTN